MTHECHLCAVIHQFRRFRPSPSFNSQLIENLSEDVEYRATGESVGTINSLYVLSISIFT